MSKRKYIKELSKELNCNFEYANKISDILEDNFLLGKKNKDKIINMFIREFNISIDEANKIYDISYSVIMKEIGNKLIHPFKNLDKE